MRLVYGAGVMGGLIGLCGILGVLFFVARARYLQSQQSHDDVESAHQDMYTLQGILPQFAASLFALLLGIVLIVVSHIFGGP